MKFTISFLFVVLFATETVPQVCDCECPQNSYPLASLEDFPHHVTIRVKTAAGAERHCSGSIITDQWILTSIRCVEFGIDFDIQFQRLRLNDPSGSFSMKVNNSSVHPYPNDRMDMALMKLPNKLTITSTVKPVRLEFQQGFFENYKALMPGFHQGGNKLSYGVYKVTTLNDCKRVYGRLFDETIQICTRGFQNNSHVPCEGNEGGGLIAFDWPEKPRLVAVFNTPLKCASDKPAIYFKVNKFIGWIKNLSGYVD